STSPFSPDGNTFVYSAIEVTGPRTSRLWMHDCVTGTDQQLAGYAGDYAAVFKDADTIEYLSLDASPYFTVKERSLSSGVIRNLGGNNLQSILLPGTDDLSTNRTSSGLLMINQFTSIVAFTERTTFHLPNNALMAGSNPFVAHQQIGLAQSDSQPVIIN